LGGRHGVLIASPLQGFGQTGMRGQIDSEKLGVLLERFDDIDGEPITLASIYPLSQVFARPRRHFEITDTFPARGLFVHAHIVGADEGNPLETLNLTVVD
jgi:hypothetical protein